MTIDAASMPHAAGMPLAVLVSLTYNFQSIKAIVAALREHGIDDPFEGDERLLRDFGVLVGFRHDRVHTSTYGDLDRRAAYDTAERLAFRLPRQFPDMEIDMYLLQGDVLGGMRLWKRSLAAYEKAGVRCAAHVARNPGSAQAHAKMGLALAGQGRREEALASYDQAVVLEPERAVTHLGRAQALAGMGRSEEALAAYDRAIALDGTYAEAHCRKAELLASLGRTDDALCFYNRAAELDPLYARALAGKGSILARMGRAAESAECHKAAHDLVPGRY